jgi:hypothetical protein
MNTRLKMALLLHSGESGFAIVIAVSLGLIMILVGLTMTLRSQEDQSLSLTQKQTEQSLAIAEKGVAFYQQFFNVSAANKRLALYNDCNNLSNDNEPDSVCEDPDTLTDTELTAGARPSWHNAISSIPGLETACNVPSQDNIRAMASKRWRDAENPSETDTSQFGASQFRLVSYQIADRDNRVQRGILTVEGKFDPEDPQNAGNVKSITRLKVEIPITPGDIRNIKVPGVWVGANQDQGNGIDIDGDGEPDSDRYGDSDGTGANNGVLGDILINNCDMGSDTIQDMQDRLDQEGSFQVKQVDISMPPLPEQPNGGAERIVDDPITPNDETTEGMIPLGDITSDITLPRPEDELYKLTNDPGKTSFYQEDETYAYTVNSMGNAEIKIEPNKKIVIFLSGNISGNTRIICSDSDYRGSNIRNQGTCNPMDLRIFGEGPEGSEICINGNRQLNAFILAPNYNAGVNGGGNLSLPNGDPTGNMRGAVWVKQWGEIPGCGSNSSNVLVEQEGSWDDILFMGDFVGNLGQQMPPNINPPATWTKEAVQ